MVLIVSPLRRVAEVIAQRSPSHLVTLLGPEEMIETPFGIHRDRHLRLGVHDIAEPQAGLTAPEAATVEQLLDFVRGWSGETPMLVHCFAGISRSTAAAFVIACERNPAADELEIALKIRRASPSAFPNRRIVALADGILDRRGRMLEAVEAMGGNNFVLEGEPFELAAKH